MTIQEALHKVEDVGYPIHNLYATTDPENVQKVFYDPIFWFALGWSLGWQEKNRLEYDLWWRQPWHRFLEGIVKLLGLMPSLDSRGCILGSMLTDPTLRQPALSP